MRRLAITLIGVAMLTGCSTPIRLAKAEFPTPDTLEKKGRASDYEAEFDRYCGATSDGEAKRRPNTDGSNRTDWKCREGEKVKDARKAQKKAKKGW